MRHRPRWLFVILLALLIAAPGYGVERLGGLARPGATTPHKTRLQSLFDAAVREGLPRVSLRVKAPGIAFQGAAGVAEQYE